MRFRVVRVVAVLAVAAAPLEEVDARARPLERSSSIAGAAVLGAVAAAVEVESLTAFKRAWPEWANTVEQMDEQLRRGAETPMPEARWADYVVTTSAHEARTPNPELEPRSKKQKEKFSVLWIEGRCKRRPKRV